jgi:hypothetical protein
MAKRKVKIEKQIQDLKASIVAKRGTSEEWSIEHAEAAANVNDVVEWYGRVVSNLVNNMLQMARLLDEHVPDWRERITLSKTPNLKTVKTLGITVPPSIMVRADEVIE